MKTLFYSAKFFFLPMVIRLQYSFRWRNPNYTEILIRGAIIRPHILRISGRAVLFCKLP